MSTLHPHCRLHLHQPPRNIPRCLRATSSIQNRHRQKASATAQLQCNPNRRSLLLLSTTALTLPPSIALASTTITKPPQAEPHQPSLDTTITDRIFLDFSICSTFFRTDQGQTLGEAQLTDVPPCPTPEPIGRVVLGLYGKLVPITVSNFKALSIGSSSPPSSPWSSYKNTLVHKIFPGQYFVAGRQGERREKGQVRPPMGLTRNLEAVESKAFMLKHSRDGILSLCLGENDDDNDVKLDPEYRNVEFLITTGPGPCPQLDNSNIVFGEVLEGLDIVRSIAAVPTYEPGERIQQFNSFANFLGDERAKNARYLWNRPLKTVYISDCGELEVSRPSLSPTLP